MFTSFREIGNFPILTVSFHSFPFVYACSFCFVNFHNIHIEISMKCQTNKALWEYWFLEHK